MKPRRLVVLMVAAFVAGFVLAFAWLSLVGIFATRPGEYDTAKLVTVNR